MKKIIILTQLICMILMPPVINAQEITQDRPKIGLVLSGGGARGAAHVGVLKILEENKIPVDMIAGTSFGAIVGGLYAAGYNANELERILENIDWQETLSNSAPRRQRSFRRKKDDDGFLIKFKVGFEDGNLKLPSGLITPNNLRLTLGDLTNQRTQVSDFDNLAIPFRAVATNLENGDEVVLKEGNLASAMVASMTVPALFPPVELNGSLLVDGGVANNIPINVARTMGADIVIVVDISTPLLKKDKITSFASVLDQLTMLQSHKESTAQLATLTDRDVLIRPDLENVGFVDFENALDAVPKGIEAAIEALPILNEIALETEEWYAHLAARSNNYHDQPVIDFIRIKNDSDASDEIIRSKLSAKVGEKFNGAKISADLTDIYGLELFEEVNYQILEENGSTGIEVRAKQREDGEDYLRFGLALQEDFEGESGFQMAAGFTNLAVNSRGGEWQALFKVGQEFSLFTEFYQPIDFKENYYMFANAKGSKVNRNILSDNADGSILGQVRISELEFQVGGGRNLGNWGTIRAGLQRSYGDFKGRIGVPSDTQILFAETAFVVDFHVDTLDNTQFPTSGLTFDVQYENSLSLFGGDSIVDSISVSSYKPMTWGKNTLGLRSLFATTFNGRPNETDLFALGGFLNLTAFAPGQLTGNHGGLLAAIYYYRISGGPQYLTEMPIYIGGTIEAGNVWNRRSDISLGDLRWSSSAFVGIDTILGPTYLGIGVGSKGATAAFLNVGQVF